MLGMSHLQDIEAEMLTRHVSVWIWSSSKDWVGRGIKPWKRSHAHLTGMAEITWERGDMGSEEDARPNRGHSPLTEEEEEGAVPESERRVAGA